MALLLTRIMRSVLQHHGICVGHGIGHCCRTSRHIDDIGDGPGKPTRTAVEKVVRVKSV